MVEVPTKFIVDDRRFDLEIWINDLDNLEIDINAYLPYRVYLGHYSKTDMYVQHQYIKDNLQGIWACSVIMLAEFKQIYFFQNENDAILFKLRWG